MQQNARSPNQWIDAEQSQLEAEFWSVYEKKRDRTTHQLKTMLKYRDGEHRRTGFTALAVNESSEVKTIDKQKSVAKLGVRQRRQPLSLINGGRRLRPDL